MQMLLVLLHCFATISKKKQLKFNWTLAFLCTTFPGDRFVFIFEHDPPDVFEEHIDLQTCPQHILLITI